MNCLKLIEEHPGYCVSATGQVFAMKLIDGTQYKIIELQQDYSNGHARVKLNYIHEDVGRLVTKAFIKNNSSYYNRVFHIDRNPCNNAVENLCWMTDSEVKIASQWSREYCLAHLPQDLDILRANQFVPI